MDLLPRMRPLSVTLPLHSAVRGALLFACFTLSRHPAPAQSPRNAALLVVNQGDATLSIVDPSLGKLVATVAEGVPSMIGHEVAVTPDGRTAFVGLYGDSGVGKPGVDGRILLAVDVASHKIVHRLDFGHGVRPHCMVYDRTSNLLYVSTEIDKAITIVDPRTLTIVGSIPTTQEQSHMLAISHDGKRGYTANVGPGTVSVLDLTARKFVGLIPISSSTQRISISPDDRTVFTADQAKPRLAVIDTGTNQVADWIELPSLGYGTAPSADGRWLLVTLPTAGQLAVVDLATRKVVHTLDVGPKPQEVLFRPDGKTAYVSCFNANYVTEIDTSNWQVVRRIEVGNKADGMAWAENRGTTTSRR